MNLLHGFFPAGIVLASLVVGRALDGGVHWRTTFAVTALPIALVAFMFLVGRYPSAGGGLREPSLGVRQALGNRTFWLLAFAMALTAGCEGCLIFWGPNFIQHEYDVTAFVAAWGLGIFGIGMAVGRFGTGAAVKIARLEILMVALAFLAALASLSLAVVNNLWMSMVFLGLGGLSIACFWPSILTVANMRIAEHSATLMALLAVAGIVGFGTIPLVTGLVAELFGLRVGLGLVPAAMAIAGLVLLKVAGDPVCEGEALSV